MTHSAMIRRLRAAKCQVNAPDHPYRPILTDAARPATFNVRAVDETGAIRDTPIAGEHPLTLYVDKHELVTLMTLGAAPEALAIGYLRNQRLIDGIEEIEAVQVDWDVNAVVVKTKSGLADLEAKTRKRTTTSGCGQGTVFGDLMEEIETIRLDPEARLRTSWLYALSRAINTTPSLYLEAGAIHGCVLCEADRPLVYMEDVGRHNAVDKIAGYMFREGLTAHGKIFYTTGRLTSEMVIKTAKMGIPILVSRSGFTAWGVELARQVGMTLIGRMKGRRFLVLAGEERVVWDADPAAVVEEGSRHRRKGSVEDAA
jgi:FdhD protein